MMTRDAEGNSASAAAIEVLQCGGEQNDDSEVDLNATSSF
jgi:hypothetical protein